MIDKLKAIYDEFTSSVSSVSTESDLLNLKSDYLGKKGKVSEVLKGLKSATNEERKSIGPLANEIKNKIQA